MNAIAILAEMVCAVELIDAYARCLTLDGLFRTILSDDLCSCV
jgi:hypothetical protein